MEIAVTTNHALAEGLRYVCTDAHGDYVVGLCMGAFYIGGSGCQHLVTALLYERYPHAVQFWGSQRTPARLSIGALRRRDSQAVLDTSEPSPPTSTELRAAFVAALLAQPLRRLCFATDSAYSGVLDVDA